MMLLVPSPLPLGTAARVVNSIPPPKNSSILVSVTSAGQLPTSGENPLRASAVHQAG